jgi:uncharacterized damage-inducible protein DinB
MLPSKELNMNITGQIAKHLRDAYFNKNWTGVNMKDSLDGITWQQATTKVNSLNTIAMLVFHINYYIDAAIKVLQGEPLTAHDKYSYDCPSIQCDKEWHTMLAKTWADVERFALLIEQLPDTKLSETFANEKYGTYYRNLLGTVEHTYYHMGQIVMIKKMLIEAGIV